MEGHLEYKDNRVVISDELRKKPLFFKFYTQDKSQNKKDFYDFMTYLYFVYDTSSVYKRFLPEERKLIVLEERCGCDKKDLAVLLDVYENLDGFRKAIIDDYLNTIKTEEERLFDLVAKKIEEYITFANSFKIDLKNYSDVISLLKGTNELLEFKEKVQQQVYKTGTKKEQGNARKTFIEEKLSQKIQA